MTTPVILVVEDNPITRKSVTVALQEEGYRVMEAPDGRTALAQTQSERPHLVLQGLVLPDIDGYDLVRRLRGVLGSDVPILAFAGSPERRDVRGSPETGFHGYLYKPVRPAALVETVQTYLASPGQTPVEPGAGARVLLAHHDDIQREGQKACLEQAGFKVQTAPDGQRALEGARRWAPQAVVSDMLMPGLDGFQLCAALRQDPQLASLPVVLVSAATSTAEEERLAALVRASAVVPATPDCRPLIAALVQKLEEQARLPPAPFSETYSLRLGRRLEHQLTLNDNNGSVHRLELREAELAILASFTDMLQRSPSVDALLDELLYRFLDASGVSYGLAYVMEPEGQLSLRARLGYSETARLDLETFFGQDGFLRRVVEEGESVVAPSPHTPVPAELLERVGARSIVFVPLGAGQGRRVLLLMVSPDRELSQDWAAFAQAVRSQLGLALQLAGVQAEVRESCDRLGRVVENLVEGVLIVDPQGRPTLVNAAAREFAEAPPPELAALWRSVFNTGQPVRDRELEIRTPQGGCRIVLVNCTPLPDASGATGAVETSLWDITSHRRQVEELARSNAELNRFAWVVAHDLKEPLRTVAGMSQSLTRRCRGLLDQEAAGLLDRVTAAAGRMQRLIDDLLTWARVGFQSDEPAAVSSEEVFQAALANLQAAIEESGAQVVHDPLPSVRGNAVELGQVFQNLLANAFKFHGPEPPRVEVRAEPGAEQWTFSVRDNGIGIAPQDAPRVFQVFERLHSRERYEGTGIGLAVCKKIVERHGGRIWVESQLGQGSTFRFTVPAVGNGRPGPAL